MLLFLKLWIHRLLHRSKKLSFLCIKVQPFVSKRTHLKRFKKMAGAFFCLKIPRLSYLAGLCSFYGNKNVPIGRAHMEPPWIFSFQSLVHLCEVKCKLLPSWAQHFSQLSKLQKRGFIAYFDRGSFIFMIFARMFQHNSVFVQRYMWHITLYTLLLLIVVHRRQKNVGNNGKQTLGFNFVWERAFHSFKSQSTWLWLSDWFLKWQEHPECFYYWLPPYHRGIK